jgi:hypothetical protein
MRLVRTRRSVHELQYIDRGIIRGGYKGEKERESI